MHGVLARDFLEPGSGVTHVWLKLTANGMHPIQAVYFYLYSNIRQHVVVSTQSSQAKPAQSPSLA